MANVKRGGRALTGILCFIFGFIFAIIAEVAVIAAGIYYLLYKTELEDLLSTVGIENTDEEGNYIYINTEKMSTISELISQISELASGFDVDSTTLNDLDEYFPAIGTAVDTLYDTLSGVLSDYMDADEFGQIFDKDELMNTPISGLSGFIYDSLLSANVEIIFDIARIDVTDNALFMALAYGAKATVGTYNGNTVPLSVETLTKAEETVAEIATYSLSEGSTYIREDGTYLSSDYDGYVVEESDGTYALYCYVTEDNTAYVAQYDEDSDSFTVTGTVYEQYSSDYTTISGAYYYDGSTLEIISKHTLGDYVGADADITAVFDDIYISDLLSDYIDEESEVGTLLSLLDGYSVGDLINGDIDFDMDSMLESVYVAELIDVSADNAIMMYFGYAITGVTAVEGEEYDYTGTINFYTENTDENSEEEWSVTTATAYITIDEETGYISSVYYYEGDDTSGEEIEYSGVSADGFTALFDNFMDALTVGDLIEITNEDSKLLQTLADYQLSDLSNAMEKLYVSDVIDITDEDSKLLQKLGGYKLSEISTAMDEITLSDVIDNVYTDDTIIAYMVYGINDISVDSSTGVGTAMYHCLDEDCGCDGIHVVTVVVDTDYKNVDEEGIVTGYLITKVYYTTTEIDEDGNFVNVEVGTNINDVSDRISAMLDDLTIGEIIVIGEGNTILEALSGSTINSLSSDIQNLTIQELFADEIYGVTEMYEVVDSSSATGGQITFNEAYLYYYKDSDGEYVLVGHLDEYTIEYGTLYTYGAPQGVWKLLLYTTDETGTTSYEVALTVNDVADMQKNVLDNLQTFTLNDLYTIGVLTSDSGLDTSITYNGTPTTVGQLTISQFLTAFSQLQSSGS